MRVAIGGFRDQKKSDLRHGGLYMRYVEVKGERIDLHEKTNKQIMDLKIENDAICDDDQCGCQSKVTIVRRSDRNEPHARHPKFGEGDGGGGGRSPLHQQLTERYFKQATTIKTLCPIVVWMEQYQRENKRKPDIRIVYSFLYEQGLEIQLSYISRQILRMRTEDAHKVGKDLFWMFGPECRDLELLDYVQETYGFYFCLDLVGDEYELYLVRHEFNRAGEAVPIIKIPAADLIWPLLVLIALARKLEWLTSTKKGRLLKLNQVLCAAAAAGTEQTLALHRILPVPQEICSISNDVFGLVTSVVELRPFSTRGISAITRRMNHNYSARIPPKVIKKKCA